MDTADELNPLGLLVGIKKIRSLYFDILAFLCFIWDNRPQSANIPRWNVLLASARDVTYTCVDFG